MANFWDDFTKTIRDGVDTVVEKTEEFTKIGRHKVDIINIKRNIEKNFAELGGRVYHLMVEKKKTQISDDKEVKVLLERVKVLEKKLKDKNVEIEKIKTKQNSSQGANGKSTPASKPKAVQKKKPTTAKKTSIASKAKKTTSSKK